MEPRGSAQPSRAGRTSALSTVAGALLVGICVAIAGGTYAHFTTGAAPWTAQAQTDRLSDEARSNRQQAFLQLGPVPLHRVEAGEVKAAVEGMRLPPAARQEVQALRLAWITLWDTDVQDGDVVRIDSAGYSRTITLTKHGETFAVPVPANGIVTVTGIKDGDGGGITVGLASGAAKAVFPIMSTGQSLGLQVTID